MPEIKIDVEIWVDIEGYEGLYQVSNFGRVRSLDRIGDNGRIYKGVTKALSDNGRGYLQVNLKIKGKQRNLYIHRLVAQAFIPNPENKPEVNHIDGDKSNNFVSNLEWVTHVENVKHCFENGLNKNAGSPLKVFVFDGDHTVVYNSYKELGNHLGKSDTWCGKRFEKGDKFNYKGLTISKTEPDIETRIIFDVDNIGEINDGSHSVDELYYHRMMLFAVICNTYTERAWKSWKHDDGTMYENYFIVGITTDKGDYTYHYHKDHWDMFNVMEKEYAPKWDGHKPKDITRLLTLVKERDSMKGVLNEKFILISVTDDELSDGIEYIDINDTATFEHGEEVEIIKIIKDSNYLSGTAYVVLNKNNDSTTLDSSLVDLI